MIPVSVVIITKNEASAIAGCINAARSVTDDIVVVDNDSTDATTAIACSLGCRVYNESWDGYGANKNKGVKLARYDWILSIDADEMPDEELIRALYEADLHNPEIVYDIAFKTYYGKKPVHFGSWGRDHHIRLFNRKLVRWSETQVHETLLMPPFITVKKLQGRMHHYSVKNRGDYQNKATNYAMLCAEKYYMAGKRATFIKLHIAPLFHFLKNYIAFLGFIDGREGFEIAKIIARHTRIKYRMLQKMGSCTYPDIPRVKENLVMEYQ